MVSTTLNMETQIDEGLIDGNILKEEIVSLDKPKEEVTIGCEIEETEIMEEISINTK